MIVSENGSDMYKTKEILSSFNGGKYAGGYQINIYETFSGKGAISSIEEAARKGLTPDVLFITQKMNGFSGVQTAITIKAKNHITTPAMMLMCENIDSEVKKGAAKAGIKRLLQLPLTNHEVQEALFSIIDERVKPMADDYDANCGGWCSYDVKADVAKGKPSKRLTTLCKTIIQGLNKTVKLIPWYERAYKLIGDCATTMQDYRLAILHYRTAIQIQEKDTDTHAKLRYCFERIGQHKYDMSDLKSMLMKNPKSSEMNLRVGDAFYIDGDPNNALPFFQNSVKHIKKDDSNHIKAKAHWGLGRTLMAFDTSKKNMEKAKKELELAVEAEPLLAGAKLSLAKLYKKIGMKKESNHMIRQAETHLPDNAPDWLDLFLLYLEEKNIQKAKAALSHAITLDRVNPLLLFMAGEAYVRQQMWQDAKLQFNASLDLYPSDTRTYNFLGICYRNLKDIAGAKKSYATALNIDPEDYNVIYNLGVLELQSGNKKKALKNFEKALSLNPKLTYAKHGIKRCKKGAI